MVDHIDFDGVRRRHPLGDVARRTGLLVATESGDALICCPLPAHDDRTPSMMLHLSTDRYHCFGCGSHGDVIQLVRDLYGVSVGNAVRMLDGPDPMATPPARAPVDRHRATAVRSLAERPDLERTSPERVKAALTAAWNYYTSRDLQDQAVAYLVGRGIDVVTLERYTGRPEVGHTPSKSPVQLVTRLAEKGFGDDELVDAGLGRRYPTRRPIDAYRDRVLIPVRDESGQVVGLIGRYDGHRNNVPKYLNPTRTATYDKSVNLYRPLPAPASDGRVVVVEGTLDAMAVAIAAVRSGQTDRFCPVTQSGKGLSDVQLGQLIRMHPGPLVIAFDGDIAGKEANERLFRACRMRGREATVIRFPANHDPSSWLELTGPTGMTVFGAPGLAPMVEGHDLGNGVGANPPYADRTRLSP